MGRLKSGEIMEAQPTSTVDLSALLTKEQEELNIWNRTALQIFFAWYSVFLTVNGAGLAWAFPLKRGSRPIFVIFAFWNLLGIAMSMAVLRYVKESSKRVTVIYESLLHDQECTLMPKSPLPFKVTRVALIIDIVAMTSLFLAWSWLCYKAC
jgi:hypothetical protein